MKQEEYLHLYSKDSFEGHTTIKFSGYYGILPYYLRPRSEADVRQDDHFLRQLILRKHLSNAIKAKLEEDKESPNPPKTPRFTFNHNTNTWLYGQFLGTPLSEDFAGNLTLSDPSILVPDFIVAKATRDGHSFFPLSLNFITDLLSKDEMDKQIEQASFSLQVLKNRHPGTFQHPCMNFFLPSLPISKLPSIVRTNTDPQVKFFTHGYTAAILDKFVDELKRWNFHVAVGKRTLSLDQIYQYVHSTFPEKQAQIAARITEEFERTGQNPKETENDQIRRGSCIYYLLTNLSLPPEEIQVRG